MAGRGPGQGASAALNKDALTALTGMHGALRAWTFVPVPRLFRGHISQPA